MTFLAPSTTCLTALVVGYLCIGIGVTYGYMQSYGEPENSIARDILEAVVTTLLWPLALHKMLGGEK